MDEEDPAQCRALESSLWEIKVCAVCDGFRFRNESFMTPTTTELCLVSAEALKEAELMLETFRHLT